MLLDEEKNKKKGRFQDNPLLILIWAVMPIVVIFGNGIASLNHNKPTSFEDYSIFILGLVQVVSMLIMFVVTALLIAFVYKKDVLSFLNMRKLPKVSHLLLAAGIILSANLFLNYLLQFNEMIPLPGNLTDKFQQLHDSATEGQALFLNFTGSLEFAMVFLTIAIIPAIAEEMYFRGLIEGVLLDMKIGAFHAIFISSFLFAIMHFQFYYLLPLLFMGALLGYFYYRTKNLWLSIFMHLMNNGLIVILTLSNKTGLTSVDLDADPPILASVIGFLVFCGLVFLFHQKTKESKF